MTTYPADAIEAASRAYYVEIAASDGIPENEAIAMWERDELSDFKDGIVRRARACVAAFDAAMLAHGWKRVQVVEQPKPAWDITDAAPEVKP